MEERLIEFDPVAGRSDNTTYGTHSRIHNSQTKFPRIVKFNMALLGYLNLQNYQRKCFQCEEKARNDNTSYLHCNVNIQIPTGNSQGGDEQTCKVCSSLHPSSFGCNQTGAPRTSKLSSLWLLALAILLLIGLINNMIERWGRKGDEIYFLSYIIYVLPGLLVISCRLLSIALPSPPADETEALCTVSRDHVLSQLGYINSTNCYKLGYFYAFFGLLRIPTDIIYHLTYVLRCDRIDWLQVFVMIGEHLGLLCFSAFCYMIFLIRKGLEKNLKITVNFLKANILDVDLCRQRLMESHTDYMRLHKFSSRWIVFQTALSTFHCFYHISWNYSTFKLHKTTFISVLWNINIWIEIVIFFVLPLMAVNGFGITRLWQRFVYRFQRERKHEKENSWLALAKTIKYITPTKTTIIPTLVFSILGVVFALRLTTNDVEYWNEDAICLADPFNDNTTQAIV